jgi:hypothetical protein
LGWYAPVVPDGSVGVWQNERRILLAIGEPHSDWSVLHAWFGADETMPSTDSLPSLVNSVRLLTVVCSVVAVDRLTGAVCVCSDSLAVRPWYWTENSGQLIVSSTRRAMRELSGRPVDALGVIQTALAGFTLGPRTSIAGVRRNTPGQVVIHPDAGRHQLHTRTHLPAAVSPAAVAEQLAYEFPAAVRRRLGVGQQPARAFLSGGLDSRVVVATLADLGEKPRTYSLAAATLADTTIAKQFAQTLSLPFSYMGFVAERRILWAGRLRKLLAELEDVPADEVVAAWSGDGGSVGVGGVYVTERRSQLLRTALNGDSAPALRDLGLAIPRNAISRAHFSALEDAMRTDLEEELTRIQQTSGEVNAYRFFMDNDQRQHLDTHFENWQAHRVHYLLPFYDRRVTALLAAQPEDQIAYHAVYEKWLDLLPSSVTAVPYQTYPGHAPSRKPLPSQLRNQFDRASLRRFHSRLGKFGRQAFGDWVVRGAPDTPPLSRGGLILAGLTELFRVRRSTVALLLLQDLANPDSAGGLELE